MKAGERSLWCIHGNLQQPTVWDIFRDKFFDSAPSPSEPAIPLGLRLVNLWETEAANFRSWAAEFCDKVRAENKSPQLLMGYSLGGRLAFHAVLHRPKLWQGAVIISADSGLTSERERRQRLLQDQEWGRRFRTENWPDLLSEWDTQCVFAGRQNPEPRTESAFSRTEVERLFDIFSLGRQENLLPQLAALKQPPILFVYGEEDLKYRQVGKILSAVCPAIEHVTVVDAAHRVPWDNSEDFKSVVQEFITRRAGAIKT